MINKCIVSFLLWTVADQFRNIRTGNDSDCTNATGIIASSNADSQGNL